MSGTTRATEMRPLKVLVIDDDPIAAEVARDRLERMGHTVFVRDSAIGTIGWIVSARPDVVLVDLNLPEIRGSDLARMVRDRMDLNGIVTILYTSATGKELDNAIRSGGAGVISKGMNDEMFMDHFRRHVQGKTSERRSSGKIAIHRPGVRDKDSLKCTDCGTRAPETPTTYTLIHDYSWRSAKGRTQSGKLMLEWRCPSCWVRHRGARNSTLPPPSTTRK